MKILFLDFDGVITTYESCWKIDLDKLILIDKIVKKTNAKIVVSSSWKHSFDDVKSFKNSIYNKVQIKDLKKELILENFIKEIYDITDSLGLCRGDEIQRWLNNQKDVESYVILDDGSDFHKKQLFNFVQTDLYEGLTEREVKLCIQVLNKERIINPIRLNLELTMMWRNYCNGLDKENDINELLMEYRQNFLNYEVSGFKIEDYK